MRANALIAVALTISLLRTFSDDRIRSLPGNQLFGEDALPQFQIEIDASALQKLRESNREYVRATVMVNGQTLRNAGIRLKGHGSFQPLDAKPSLALKFDEFTPTQRLFGLSKVLLNNAAQDTTLMSEFLASALFREANVPAARVGHARVELNGRDLGFYALAEAMNKVFLKQHFSDATGNLYEADARDITGPFEQDGGKTSDQSDLRALVAATSLPEPARTRRLREVLDVDRFLSFLAVSMLSSHHDSYPLNQNNYRLYHDPASKRFVMIPHGIDGSFSQVNLPLLPPRKYLLTQAVLESDDQQRIYRERAELLFTNIFKLEAMTNRILAAARRLRAAAKSDAERATIDTRASAFARRVTQRHRAVANQLGGIEPVRLVVERESVLPPSDWYEEVTKGSATFSRTETQGRSLHINIGSEPSVASWRKNVTLAPGAYRFTAQVRVTNPTAGAASGAVLRISGKPVVKQISSTGNWDAADYAFTVLPVPEEGDVVLVCELRGTNAEGWFDVASLRLHRN